MADKHSGEIRVYIGTFTNDRNEGIYRYLLEPASGALRFAGKTAPVENPFFLEIDSRQRCLYAANGVGEQAGEPGGAVSAFSIVPRTGELQLLNQQPAGGKMPCYLSIDPTHSSLLVGNYTSGSVAVLPIGKDGSLQPATELIQHQGSSVDPQRQEGPHVHSIVLDPAGRFAFAADLGTDQVVSYRLDAEQGKLELNDPPFVQVQAGAGPRHLAFHPNGRFAYLIDELDNTFVVFAYDAARGALTQVQTLSTLPDGFAGVSYCADVQIHPSGRFLYGSNRGHDSIALFAVDPETGRLDPLGHESTQGHFPWNLAIDPTRQFLLVANQGSDSVVVFRIDSQTGKLTATGHRAEVPKPVCVKLLHDQ